MDNEPCEACVNHDPRDRRDHGHIPQHIYDEAARLKAKADAHPEPTRDELLGRLRWMLDAERGDAS